ncbi:MAG: sulfatase-like hydrolase/transferase [Planctomycetes bacterium]|nr:sulfatase-like hydrolase/transferase [Planctomycetota bacterium]
MAKKPHVLIFNPDQWRGDVLGHMGNGAAVTPNVDRLAERDGVSFRNAFCQNPVCTPSRCSFMTGWYPHTRGHRTMFHMLRRDEPVLLKTLKDNGYYVWWGGKNDLVPAQYEDPYGPFCDEKYEPERPEGTAGDPDDECWRGAPDSDTYYSFYHGKVETGGKPYWNRDLGNVLGAVELLKNRKEAAGDKPLCIYLPLTGPHPTYRVHEPFYGMTDPEAIPERAPTPEGWKDKPIMLRDIQKRQNMFTWTEERWRELRRTYYGMCSWMDHLFGLVVEALKETGAYDDTAIFFFSDHGDFTGDYGLVEKNQNTFEDCLTRVPFLVKPPAWIKCRGGVSDAIVELIDMPATVEAWTGITPGHTHFGRSLEGVVTGEAEEHRDAAFCEGGRLLEEKQSREFESTSSTNPKGHYWPRVGLQTEDTIHHGKAVMCRTKEFKYVQRLYEKDEFYDLKQDPMEIVNEIDNPEYAGALEGLKERMLKFHLETNDNVPFDTDARW